MYYNQVFNIAVEINVTSSVIVSVNESVRLPSTTFLSSLMKYNNRLYCCNMQFKSVFDEMVLRETAVALCISGSRMRSSNAPVLGR